MGLPFRSFAATALIAFVAAQTLCFAHCNFARGRDVSATLSCHSATPGQQPCHGKDGTPSSVPSPAISCSTLQNLFLGDASIVAVPEFNALHALVPLVLAFEMSATEPDTHFLRQPIPPSWVFTPEVSLGPAFRSLAPPVVS